MTANELIRKLRRLGAEIDASHGKGSHARVTLNGGTTYLPLHGKKDIKKGLLHGILKALGLTADDIR